MYRDMSSHYHPSASLSLSPFSLAPLLFVRPRSRVSRRSILWPSASDAPQPVTACRSPFRLTLCACAICSVLFRSRRRRSREEECPGCTEGRRCRLTRRRRCCCCRYPQCRPRTAPTRIALTDCRCRQATKAKDSRRLLTLLTRTHTIGWTDRRRAAADAILTRKKRKPKGNS